MSDGVTRRAVFDASAVSSLTGHADDLEFAHVFVARFRRLLPGRVRRIEEALASQAPKAAMDAVLSLKVSAGTLGAEELCELSTRIEEHVRRSDLTGALTVAEGLAGARRRADAELAAFIAG